MNIGILGGTFDPVHAGHIKMAKTAYKNLALDKVVFVPTNNPPHKSEITDSVHRINMVRLATSDFPHFEVSDMEIFRKGTVYTADTLEYLVNKYPENSYVFILGADSLLYINDWYRPDKIMKYARLAVCARDDAYSESSKLNDCRESLIRRYNADIVILDFKCVDISSSEIRKNIYNNPELVKSYISDDVYSYIVKEGLYKNEI